MLSFLLFMGSKPWQGIVAWCILFSQYFKLLGYSTIANCYRFDQENCGTISSIRMITIANNHSYVGEVPGAVYSGGSAGNQLGFSLYSSMLRYPATLEWQGSG